MHVRVARKRVAGSGAGAAAWVLAGVVAAAQTAPRLERFDVESYDVEALLRAAEAGAPFPLRLLGEEQLVEVQRTFLRSGRFRARALGPEGARPIYPAPARTFKGTLVGDEASHVRLSFSRRGLTGSIRTGEGWVFIEPSPPGPTAGVTLETGTAEHRVYSEADLDPFFAGTCIEREVAARAPLAGEAAQVSAEQLPAPADLRILEVAVDADYEYYAIHGPDSVQEIEGLLNTVEGIFESELGLTLDIVSVNVWEDEASDPYTATDALDLLLEFQDYWNSENGSLRRDVAHLFTGKNLDGSTVGIAYLDAVCYTSSAYGLSQEINSPALMPILVAHELGHNLGAGHDDIESDPRYIMYPSISSQVLSEFSDASASEIASYVASVGCLAIQEDEPGGGGGGDGGNGGDSGGGGGGGGGGPVDPLLYALLVAGAAAGARRRRRLAG